MITVFAGRAIVAAAGGDTDQHEPVARLPDAEWDAAVRAARRHGLSSTWQDLCAWAADFQRLQLLAAVMREQDTSSASAGASGRSEHQQVKDHAVAAPEERDVALAELQAAHAAVQQRAAAAAATGALGRARVALAGDAPAGEAAAASEALVAEHSEVRPVALPPAAAKDATALSVSLSRSKL